MIQKQISCSKLVTQLGRLVVTWMQLLPMINRIKINQLKDIEEVCICFIDRLTIFMAGPTHTMVLTHLTDVPTKFHTTDPGRLVPHVQSTFSLEPSIQWLGSKLETGFSSFWLVNSWSFIQVLRLSHSLTVAELQKRASKPSSLRKDSSYWNKCLMYVNALKTLDNENAP